MPNFPSHLTSLIKSNFVVVCSFLCCLYTDHCPLLSNTGACVAFSFTVFFFSSRTNNWKEKIFRQFKFYIFNVWVFVFVHAYVAKSLMYFLHLFFVFFPAQNRSLHVHGPHKIVSFKCKHKNTRTLFTCYINL